MELEILSKEDAEAKPAGKGQEEPNENPHLDPPKWDQLSNSKYSSIHTKCILWNLPF